MFDFCDENKNSASVKCLYDHEFGCTVYKLNLNLFVLWVMFK